MRWRYPQLHAGNCQGPPEVWLPVWGPPADAVRPQPESQRSRWTESEGHRFESPPCWQGFFPLWNLHLELLTYSSVLCALIKVAVRKQRFSRVDLYSLIVFCIFKTAKLRSLQDNWTLLTLSNLVKFLEEQRRCNRDSNQGCLDRMYNVRPQILYCNSAMWEFFSSIKKYINIWPLCHRKGTSSKFLILKKTNFLLTMLAPNLILVATQAHASNATSEPLINAKSFRSNHFINRVSMLASQFCHSSSY